MFGTSIGVLITYPLCGLLVTSIGWEGAFYTIGSITAVWYGFWLALVYDSPSENPFITEEEKVYISTRLNGLVNGAERPPVPWKSIFTSKPFWGLMITDSCNTWGLYTLLSSGPTYLKYMLGVDIRLVR